MPLMTKMIRYPDEKKAMGILHDGAYANRGSQDPSEQSLKDCIKDIHEFIVNDLKLTYVPESDDLDLNNIPDLGLANYANQTNVLSPDQFLLYGHKTYAFNDDLQEIQPIKIKFEFGAKNISDKNVNNIFSHRFAFDIRLRIIGNILSIPLISTQVYTNRDAGGNAASWYYSKQNPILSKGFYSGDRLYLDLIPNRCVNYSSRGMISSTNYFQYFRIYIERNENFIKLKSFTVPRSGSYTESSIFNTTNTNYVFYSNVNLKSYATQENFMIPFIDRDISNNNYPIFRTIDIDPETNKTYASKNVMFGYTSQFTGSNIEIEAELDGEVSTYYVITPNSSDNNFTYNSKLCTLLRI